MAKASAWPPKSRVTKKDLPFEDRTKGDAAWTDDVMVHTIDWLGSLRNPFEVNPILPEFCKVIKIHWETAFPNVPINEAVYKNVRTLFHLCYISDRLALLGSRGSTKLAQ